MGQASKKRRADEFQQLRLGHQQMTDEADILRKSTAWQRGKGAKKWPKKCPNLLQTMVGNIFLFVSYAAKYKSNKKNGSSHPRLFHFVSPHALVGLKIWKVCKAPDHLSAASSCARCQCTHFDAQYLISEESNNYSDKYRHWAYD